MLNGGGGAAWSHKNVAPPPVWKPRSAPSLASCLELEQKWAFGKTPDGTARGALPNRAYLLLVPEKPFCRDEFGSRILAFARGLKLVRVSDRVLICQSSE